MAQDTIGVDSEPQKVLLSHHNLNSIGPIKVNPNENDDKLEKSVREKSEKSPKNSDFFTQNVAQDTIGVDSEPQRVRLSHPNLKMIGPKQVIFENGDILSKTYDPPDPHFGCEIEGSLPPSKDPKIMSPVSQMNSVSTNLSFGVKCGQFGTCRSNTWMSPKTRKIGCQAASTEILTSISERWPPTERQSEATENVGGPLSDHNLKGDRSVINLGSQSDSHKKNNIIEFEVPIDSNEKVISVEPNKTLKSFECLSVGMAENRAPSPEKFEFSFDNQRHLSVDKSSATQVDSDDRSNDDLPDIDIKTESSKGHPYKSGISLNKSHFEVKKNAKSINGQNIKYVKRENVKISPKSIRFKSKKSGILSKSASKIKLGDISPKSEDTNSDDNLDKNKDGKMGEFRRKHGNKIGNIIAAFEDNISMNVADPKVCGNKKEKLGNAFSRMMESAKGGGFTPSPVKRKKKRLAQVKPLSMTRMDKWLQKE